MVTCIGVKLPLDNPLMMGANGPALYIASRWQFLCKNVLCFVKSDNVSVKLP